MKKAILLALGAIFVVSVWGCGSEEDKPAGPPPDDAKASEAPAAATPEK
ncbi:MAG TPA: hypothetical protein PLX06_06105 [Fimbriimonadaceae bacterium]|nr:hypothetical protein [Fimbriimonadaceae bacterium]